MTSKKMKLSQLSRAVENTLNVLQAVQYGEIESEDLTPDEERLLCDLLTVLDDIHGIDSSL